MENSHPAIISPEVFDIVQHELQKRKATGYTSSTSCFSNKIICGQCGNFYGSKVWHSTSKYRRTIWQCNYKFKNQEKCQTPHLDEGTLKQAFVGAFNSLIENKDELIQGYEEIIRYLTDTDALDQEAEKLHSESGVLCGLLQECVDENAREALDQEEYRRRYSDLVKRYEKIRVRLDEISNQVALRRAKREKIAEFIKTLQHNDVLLTEFDEELWNATVENLTVNNTNELTFTFKDETRVQWQI